jgi:nitroreductase
MSTSSIQALIEARVSTNHFDPSRKLSNEQIHELVRLATLAPSAFNFQNWKFVAVTSTDTKEKLKAAAYGQQKVADAAVTFVVCGTLAAHLELEKNLAPAVAKGIVSQSIVDTWVNMAKSAYEDNPQLQRDEALRSASLAGMTLILAAQGMGLSSGPMIGFDPVAVSKLVGLSEREVPAMLITVGYAAPGNWPQKPRKPVSQVLSII